MSRDDIVTAPTGGKKRPHNRTLNRTSSSSPNSARSSPSPTSATNGPTTSFADKYPGQTFHDWLFDTDQHEIPFQAFQNARKEINEAEYTAAAIATFITHSGIAQYTHIAAEPRKEALRFSNPQSHKSFDDYVSRIKEICEEATDQVSDNRPVIAQALLDNDLHAYEQAIRNAVASNLRVTAVITNPTETIEQLARTRPDLYPM